jgi:hypothetical protein
MSDADDDDQGCGPTDFITGDNDGLAQFKRVSYILIPPGCTNIDSLVDSIDSLGPDHPRLVTKVCITHANDVTTASHVPYPVAILMTCEHDIGQLIASQAEREARFEGIKLKVAAVNGHDVLLAAVRALSYRRRPRLVDGMGSVAELISTIIQVHAQPSLIPDPAHVKSMLSW